MSLTGPCSTADGRSPAVPPDAIPPGSERGFALCMTWDQPGTGHTFQFAVESLLSQLRLLIAPQSKVFRGSQRPQRLCQLCVRAHETRGTPSDIQPGAPAPRREVAAERMARGSCTPQSIPYSCSSSAGTSRCIQARKRHLSMVRPSIQPASISPGKQL